jgi:hypothetical protein
MKGLTMFSRTICVTFILLLMLPAHTAGQEPFFHDGTRPLSMGKAFTAMAGDENAVFYNPAGLARFEGQRLSVSGYIQQYSWHLIYAPVDGFNPNFTDRGLLAGYARRGFGVFYSVTGRGWWENVTMGGRTIFIPDAEQYTVKPVNYEHCLAASLARDMTAWLSVGLTGKYLHFSDYWDTDPLENSDGASLDAGAVFYISEKLSAGVSLINLLATDIEYAVYNDYSTVAYFSELPVNLAAGIAWHPLDALTVTADARNILEDDVKSAFDETKLEFKRSYHAGVEWRPAGWLSLRAGWYFNQRVVRREFPVVPFGSPGGEAYEYAKYNALTLGAGFLYRGVSFDLAIKMDDRRERMDEKETIEMEGTTVLGSAALSYSF